MKKQAMWILVLAACGGSPDEAPRPTRAAPSAPLPREVVPDERGRVAVTVDGSGYHPERIHARAGQALTLVFTRTADSACAEEVVFPDLNIRRQLPLNQPVEIPVTAQADVRFACGMDMMRGAIVAHTAP